MKIFDDTNIFGAILAGGKAVRMAGAIKGNLTIPKDGISIIQHQLNELHKSDIETIVISANDPQPYRQYKLPILPDRTQNIGPLGGIISILEYYQSTKKSTKETAVLFLPCDLPRITAREITALKNFYFQMNTNVVFSKVGNNNHPLCVIINIQSLPDIRKVIEKTVTKVMDAWLTINAKTLEFPDEKPFLNINETCDIKKL